MYPDFVELRTFGYPINDTGPEIGVCFHWPQSEMGIEKMESTCGEGSGGGKFFFQLLELGYKNIPHNTTGSSIHGSNLILIYMYSYIPEIM